ncbi:CarD family transcriptional regulator [Bhargavaea beijingensis]|nr:CarD family transcriptional regulator [Bhargavaea beijingensis]MCW1927779.1 CarD family transcriptional regulator [Bhargavaea beijingensis]SDE80903.1 transcriptional regulator, CarD family [Bhargavaea beijingensis]
MFEIGDVVIYSEHGLCKIDDICKKDLFGETRLYYVLHPIGEQTLKISTPVDGKKKRLMRTMNRKEAEELMDVFGSRGIDWVENPKQRARAYQSLVQSGDRQKIAEVTGALMDKKLNTDQKIYDQDRKLLNHVQTILFRELSMALGISVEDVANQVEERILAATPQ